MFFFAARTSGTCTALWTSTVRSWTCCCGTTATLHPAEAFFEHAPAGYINPALYQIANDPTKYAKDYYDVTMGNNQTSSIPGYNASRGWDAVTGLGSPNVANLLPDLIAATP